MITLRKRRTGTDRSSSLRQVALFSHCDNAQLRRISALMTKVEVKRGAVLIKEGRVGHEFFVVGEGTATATREGMRLADFGPGSFFGEVALFDQGLRSATVWAATDMSLFVLSRSEFWSLLGCAPQISQKITVELCKRQRKTNDLLNREVSRSASLQPVALVPASGS